MFKIREIEIPNRVVLAPMAGVCNAAFRLTAKEFGAGLVCAEMVSDKAILFNNKKTMNMLYIDPRERPLSLQIFGGEIDTLVEAAKYVDKNTEADIIDLNMGCPVPKITKVDAGSKLLLDPDKVYEVISRIVDSVSKPVTVKMRMGWDDEHIFVGWVGGTPERFLFCGFPVFALSYSVRSAFRCRLARFYVKPNRTLSARLFVVALPVPCILG